MPKILLIELDRPLRDAMADALTVYGYHVDTARDGGEGASKIHHDNFDIVVADVYSADDGEWVLRQGRAPGSDVPIICISGHRQAALRDAALEAGAVAYLVKPVTAADLHHAIEEALGLTQGP